MSLTLRSIHVHPVKSLGGFAVEEARLTDRGLEHDRRWMLVDEGGRFLSQRELAAMACLHCGPTADGFRVSDVRNGDRIELPCSIIGGVRHPVTVWDDPVEALLGDHTWNRWFSKRLGRDVQLVYMPDSSERPTDAQYANGLTSLSDGFPFLIVSQASLDDLNARLPAPIGMERFRPNLVIAGGSPFQEDAWGRIHIGTVSFELVKPCARCVIVTTDQRTGERGKEPLRTLASYRSEGNKVLFGMNAVGDVEGVVRVGDPVTTLTA
jgi:uncharacterized protein YcbX